MIQNRRGSLTVTTSPVDGGTVPPGAQRVPMLKLTLEASCEADVSVDAVHVQRKGLGNSADIDFVYLMEGSLRISAPLQIGSKHGNVSLAVRNFTVPACATREIVLYADFSDHAAATAEHRFELTGERVESFNADVAIRSANPASSVMTTGKAVGRISAEYVQPSQSASYGVRQAVARFSLSADDKADHAISAITLRNDGSARGNDLQNLFLELHADRLTQIVHAMQDSTVRLTFDPPLLLKKNQKIVLTLRADIRTGRSRTIRFLIEQPSDIEAAPVTGR